MNMIQENNRKHQECLDIVAKFEKSGGEIIKPAGDYKTKEWQAPKPRRLVIPNN